MSQVFLARERLCAQLEPILRVHEGWAINRALPTLFRMGRAPVMLDWGLNKMFGLPSILATVVSAKLSSKPRLTANCRPIGEYREKFPHEIVGITDKVLSLDAKRVA